MRPPGYEPGELPTAPLRDVINSLSFGDISELRVQRYGFFSYYANIPVIILLKRHFSKKNQAFGIDLFVGLK